MTRGAVKALKILGKLVATLVLGILLVFSVIGIIQAATSEHWTLGILATICYSGAVYVGISELRGEAARSYPIDKTAAILLLAAFTTIAVAASASLQLLRAGWAAYDPLLSVDHGYSPLLGYYLWVLLDMMPGLKVPELLAFKVPLTPTNAAAGVPVIAFRVVVLFGLLGTLKVWWQKRSPVPHRWATVSLPEVHSALAADGSEIRTLLEMRGGSVVHCTLRPDAGSGSGVSFSTVNEGIEEIWYFLDGQGEIWRKNDKGSEIAELKRGVCLTIPSGTVFQFRTTGREALAFLCVTMPPWRPGTNVVVEERRWPIGAGLTDATRCS